MRRNNHNILPDTVNNTLNNHLPIKTGQDFKGKGWEEEGSGSKNIKILKVEDQNTTRYIQIINEIIRQKFKRTLSTTEMKVLNGVFEGKTYENIANEFDYDDGYVGEVARHLFKTISLYTGITVSKKNIVATFDIYGEKMLTHLGLIPTNSIP